MKQYYLKLVTMVVLSLVIPASTFAQHEQHNPQQQPSPQPPQSGHAGHQMTPSRSGEPQQGMAGMEGMKMKSLDELLRSEPSNLLPRIGSSQARPSGRLIRLEELEATALRKNPTLVQAAAEIRGAQGRTKQ